VADAVVVSASTLVVVDAGSKNKVAPSKRASSLDVDVELDGPVVAVTRGTVEETVAVHGSGRCWARLDDMASSKVARRRQGSLPKEPPPAINGDDSPRDYSVDSFEVLKTIG
jgi:hypothetical protein